MRLIDADELDEEVASFFMAITGNPKPVTVVRECRKSFQRMIEEQPTCGAAKTQQWIPVGERLPEKTIVTFEGTLGSEPVIVTVVKENGESYSYCDFLIGERWACTLENEKVIAWMPLPEPYREEGASCQL